MSTATVLKNQIICILIELGIPVHRIGFQQLVIAISLYAEDSTRLLSKEIYPAIATAIGCYDWRAVEHAIRGVIVYAWKRRNPDVWNQYFPGCRNAPSNKRFIATLAQFIQ